MLDFAAPFTIHAIKIGFQKHYIYLESVVLESHSSTNSAKVRSLRYFHLERISDSFAIHRSSSHTLLYSSREKFGVA